MAATKSAANVAVTYNSNSLDGYCNSADLQATATELEATDFNSTAEESDPGLSGWTIGIGGDWDATLDGYLGPDAITSTKRTASMAVTDSGSNTVTYTWTSQAFITNYQIQAEATGKLTWSANLRLSGAPSRS